MMNGVPWIVAASTDNGVEFGIFVNTLGWVYGTASAARQQLDLYSTKAAAVDILVVTWPTGSSPSGSTRADSIQGMLLHLPQKNTPTRKFKTTSLVGYGAGWYADVLGHVPVMSREVRSCQQS
jgi:hypothetical protein